MTQFEFERRVEFCETDAAGIVHFSSLLQYVEQAEHALLRSVGFTVHSGKEGTCHGLGFTLRWILWGRHDSKMC